MPKVFLDYGHGGGDPGAVAGGYKEKDIVLAIGKRVKYHLERHSFSVIESRSGDTNPSLESRSNMANANYVDVAVSLHCNSFTDKTAQGVEIYTYGQGNREIGLAKAILNQIIKAKLYTKNRGVKQANFHMVREIKTASVLLEMAFISNAEDRKILLNKQEQLAISITKGILNFYEMRYYNEKQNTTEKLYKVQVGAFKERANAERLANELKSKGYSTYITYTEKLYKVQVGAFREKANAERLANELKSKGYSTYIV
ncbi:MAG: N-acetylmuramoyl-L-alanine amidase [Clostridiales bacterium]|nr:N-acetylmuramoyl-L-alanine amidase [Clostridiales bacterium]